MSHRGTLLFRLGTPPDIDLKRFAHTGWEILVATSLPEARELICGHGLRVGLILLDEHHCEFLRNIEDVVMVDGRMEWVAVLTDMCLHSPVLCRFITENCFDYHTLPIDSERLGVVLGHAFGKALLRSRLATRTQPACEYEIVGDSPAMLEIYKNMNKMQAVDAPILISGESGTGKELVAHMIHKHSDRAQAPFVAVNCGALQPHHIQTELFGSEEGASIGAVQHKLGRIEAAEGGTIFLDEIGDLPLELQTNLLRFLQEKTIERVGSYQSIKIDARVIAAASIDLEKAVEEGRFRRDLYFRLNVLTLKMPRLCDRGGDIELLAMWFLETFTGKQETAPKRFSQQALTVMNLHSWPGNVQEMSNRIQRAVIMSDGPLITPADLGLEKRSSARNLLTLEKAREKAEREAIQYSLLCSKNNISETARQLGVSRVTLYRLMDKLQITVQHLPNPLAGTLLPVQPGKDQTP